MAIVTCDTFKDAQALAKSCASRFDIEARITSSDGGFSVHFPDQLRIKDIRLFTQTSYLFGTTPDKGFLALMAYVDRTPFSSADLAWHDPDTGLAWDVARLFYGSAQSEHPADGKELMNALQYAGLTKWRLPSIDELKTLSTEKLFFDVDTEGGSKFWSCEESLYSGPEKAFFNFESRTIGHQRFIEQNRDRQTYGDGYTEWAQTILVCSPN